MKNKNESYTASIFLSSPIGEDSTGEVFKLLTKKGFKCMDYKNNTKLEPTQFFDKYSYLESFPLLLNEAYGAITFSGTGKFISFSIEKDGFLQDFSIIIDKLIEALDRFVFAYIDYTGDPPRNISKIVEKNKIEWLFGIMYFSVDFASQYGKVFFEKIPFSKLIEIDSGVLKLILANRNGIIKNNEKEKILTYLKDNGVSSKFYSEKEFPIF